MAQTAWMLSLQNPKLGASLGCGIRAAAKSPPHPAAPEPGKSSTHWTPSWSQRERARQGPAPLTEAWHHSDPTGTGAGSVLAAELPGSSSSSGFKSSTAALALSCAEVVAKPQRGQIPANPLGHLDVGCQPGMGQLSTSGHLCPPASLSLCPQRGPQSCAPAPLLLLAAQHGGALHTLLLHTPKGIFPSPGDSANPSAHSPLFHCPVLLCRDVLSHPFLSIPPQSLQCEGPVGVTTQLRGAEHTALGVQVLPWLGAIRISITRATPALLMHGVNQFCTGTSSCHPWDLADWNNPCIRRGKSVPSDQVLSTFNLEINQSLVSPL
ncbi:hypothetical protein Nmel_016621, partial [Mimus melanotis]